MRDERRSARGEPSEHFGGVRGGMPGHRKAMYSERAVKNELVLRMGPLRRDYGVTAVSRAATSRANLKLRRGRLGKSVTMMVAANAARVRRGSCYCQCERKDVSGESEQQQKSDDRTLHRFRRRPNPTVKTE